MITGEPVPVAKAPGDKVTGATMNGNDSLLIRAERGGADTLLARIIHMVGEAQRARTHPTPGGCHRGVLRPGRHRDCHHHCAGMVVSRSRPEIRLRIS